MMSKTKLIVAVVLAATTLNCGDAPVTAPAGSSVFLQANPPFVIADGGVAVVTAIITEPAGTFVPNGTEVFFFTDLGRIEASRQTKDGVARVNFVADSRSGTANVLAVSGGPAQGGGEDGESTGSGTGSASVTIAIGSARPEQVLVTANPSGIRSNGSSHLIANVFDVNGNPVANVPVIFSVSASNATGGAVGVGEYVESGGAQLFTNSNGQVFDTLRSRRSLSEEALVTVTATAANGKFGTATVAIN